VNCHDEGKTAIPGKFCWTIGERKLRISSAALGEKVRRVYDFLNKMNTKKCTKMQVYCKGDAVFE